MGKENLNFDKNQVTHGARARARAKMLNNSYKVGNFIKSHWEHICRDIDELGIS